MSRQTSPDCQSDCRVVRKSSSCAESGRPDAARLRFAAAHQSLAGCSGQGTDLDAWFTDVPSPMRRKSVATAACGAVAPVGHTRQEIDGVGPQPHDAAFPWTG